MSIEDDFKSILFNPKCDLQIISLYEEFISLIGFDLGCSKLLNTGRVNYTAISTNKCSKTRIIFDSINGLENCIVRIILEDYTISYDIFLKTIKLKFNDKSIFDNKTNLYEYLKKYNIPPISEDKDYCFLYEKQISKYDIKSCILFTFRMIMVVLISDFLDTLRIKLKAHDELWTNYNYTKHIYKEDAKIFKEKNNNNILTINVVCNLIMILCNTELSKQLLIKAGYYREKMMILIKPSKILLIFNEGIQYKFFVGFGMHTRTGDIGLFIDELKRFNDFYFTNNYFKHLALYCTILNIYNEYFNNKIKFSKQSKLKTKKTIIFDETKRDIFYTPELILKIKQNLMCDCSNIKYIFDSVNNIYNFITKCIMFP